uniref:NB-ARC domain-containing protein n=1 Tax=Oryza punctata TaxID=4537 RepID=A0A0E0JVB6_ORYPU
MMSSIAGAAAGAGLRGLAQLIISNLSSCASQYIGVDMAREMEGLETIILVQLNLITASAENQSQFEKNRVQTWMRRLKGALYQAEDLLDEYEYDLLKHKMKQKKLFLFSIPDRYLDPISKPFTWILSNLSSLSPHNIKILNHLKELKNILAEARTFHGVYSGQPVRCDDTAGNRAIQATTAIREEKVFGRDKDRDSIISLLFDPAMGGGGPSMKSYSTIAIVGSGGAGKTTLLQYICCDKRVQNTFDVIWVCMLRKLDIHKHTTEIIQSVAFCPEIPMIQNLDTLQRKLKSLLLEKREKELLLVLDDVWFERRQDGEWEQFLAPLGCAEFNKGIRILVTSRSKELPSALNCRKIIALEDIEENDFLTFFRYYALDYAIEGSGELKEELQGIGDDIAKKLRRSPLEAKAVASRLRNMLDVKLWEAVRENKQLDENIMESLLWSYQHLDPKVQMCFLYCSIFPRGYMFYIDEIILLWEAEGFISSTDSLERAEGIGRQYFYDLSLSGIFYKQSHGKDSHVGYRMHDHFHDLAENLSIDDGYRLESEGNIEIPRFVRHLSISVPSLEKHTASIYNLQQLHTLIFFNPVNDIGKFIKPILKKLKKLRVLSLCFFSSYTLPKHIGKLKHLRYLNLERTSISKLPKSSCKLYHLIVLKMNTKMSKTLPKKTNNLVSLRHVNGPLKDVHNVGMLTSLEDLKEFQVKKEKGYEVGQLGSLNKLRGHLRIVNLENVQNRNAAKDANLQEKANLDALRLVWNHDTYKNNNVDLEVLEGLEPSSRLNELAIEGYRSTSYPMWLSSCSQSLRSLELLNCTFLEDLPPNLQNFARCHSLALLNLTGLKKFSPLPENLTSLKFGGCSSLCFISEEEEHGVNPADSTREKDSQPLTSSTELETLTEILRLDGSELEQFQACFQELQYPVSTISARRSDVAQLVLPLTLRRLELSSCNITDQALSECLRRLTSLKDLVLLHITTLSALPSKQVMENLAMLSSVGITSCRSLCSVAGLGAIASLEKLAISFCPSLLLSDCCILPSQLKEVTIRGCTIHDGFLHDGLPKLVSLEISKCRTPSVLQVGAWPSLKCLKLCDCLDVFFLEGLHALESLQEVQLVLPNLGADSFTGCKGNWRSLRVRTSSLLHDLSELEGFAPPMLLTIEGCQESDFSLEGIPNLSSIVGLSFMNCKVQSISAMKGLASLETSLL